MLSRGGTFACKLTLSRTEEHVLPETTPPTRPIDPLACRIRRMGWVLARSETLAELLLLKALRTARAPARLAGGACADQRIFAWAFGALDAELCQAGKVRPLMVRQCGGDLAGRLLTLPYELRVAALIIMIEDMSPEAGREVTGRSAFALASGAAAALHQLDRETLTKTDDAV